MFALKDNQPTLLDDIRFFMESDVLTQGKSTQKEAGLYAKTCEKGHGRIEIRECFVVSNAVTGPLKTSCIGSSMCFSMRIGQELALKTQLKRSASYVNLPFTKGTVTKEFEQGPQKNFDIFQHC